MAKLAMCVTTATTPAVLQQIHSAKTSRLVNDLGVLNSVLGSIHLSMQDRATCETDPSYLQLIPYVVVSDQAGKVYSYVRGSAGGEARLHAERSIGLGGHVDSLPANLMASSNGRGNALLVEQHLKAEAVRELEEEVGLKVTPDRIKIQGLLIDATTPVQEVHLGVLCQLVLDEGEELGVAEEDVIVAGQMYLIGDLLKKKAELENWSKLALAAIVDGRLY